VPTKTRDMKDAAARKPNAPRPGIKMKALAAATGVPKSTILYYLSQGLLPEPRRTGRNTAYYDSACVERIRLIQQMQERHRLTLSEIKRCIEGEPAGPIRGFISRSMRKSSARARPGRCSIPGASAVKPG